MRPALLLAALALVSCKKEEEREPSPLLDVPQSEQFAIEGLSADGHVVFDDAGVPHVYGASDEDAAAIHGFIAAQQRFLQIDLGRRLGRGTLTELVGDLALDADVEAVQGGVRVMTEKVIAAATPEQLAAFEAYARGVNAWIALVQAGDLDAPSEYETLAPLLGYAEPGDMLSPMEAADIAGVITFFTLTAGFDDREVGWTRAVSQLDGLYDGAALGELRQAGVWDDVWNRVDPVHGTVSAPDWEQGSARRSRPARPSVPHLPATLFDRAEARRAERERRWHHDPEEGWGSNAWAVGGSGTPDGGAVLAGDGHLDLSSPSIVWAVSVDSTHLAEDGGTHTYGVTSPGLPMVAAGTNGSVAWSSTQPFADINDQFAEQIRLGDDGLPAEHLFQGSWQSLSQVDDEYVIRSVPLVGSVGRTEVLPRFVLSDGRLLIDIEGVEVGADYEPAEGEAVVNLSGDWIVPGDTDGDGIITGLSMDFTGLDERTLTGFFAVAGAETVDDFADILTYTAALSQNFIAADRNGSVLFTQFQAMPCRDDLARDADGSFADGANPRFVLDGTQYGGFTIPFTEDGRLDFDHPDHCVIRPEDYPSSIDPAQGFVLSANNDPAGLSLDSDLENDSVYIGGPWEDDYRAVRIEELLGDLHDAGEATLDTMADVQADHRSGLGAEYAPLLVQAIADARDLALSGGALDVYEAQIVDAYTADADRFDAVAERLSAWGSSGYDTPSGVETAYSRVEDGDLDNAVATMIFNAWLPRYANWVIGDEPFPGSLLSTITGATGRTRVLHILHTEDVGLASYNAETGESAFFDRLGTERVETSNEGMLLSLTAALDFLESEPTGPGQGGFGTTDMDAWIWGLRHWAHFPSLLGQALGSDGALGALVSNFDINAEDVPVADGLAAGDPRADLPGWPRHGDALNIDSGNPGWSGTRFDYDFGPSFRLVIALHPDGTVSGQNVLPGGQSGLTNDAHYADQVPYWLANEALPVHWTVDEVVAAGVERYRFVAQ